MRDRAIDLRMNLQLHMGGLQLALGDLRLELDGVLEELLRRRADFADGLVAALLAEAGPLRSQLAEDEWHRLERDLTAEIEDLIRVAGFDVEDGEWRLDSSFSRERRFNRRLGSLLEKYLEGSGEAREWASRLATRAWEFSLHY